MLNRLRKYISTLTVLATLLAAGGFGAVLYAQTTRAITTTGVVYIRRLLGPLYFAAGTAMAPSMTFTGDTNTGFYLSGSHEVSFASNGSQKLIFGSDGSISGTVASLYLGSASQSNVTGVFQAASLQTASSTGYLAINSRTQIKGVGADGVIKLAKWADETLGIGLDFSTTGILKIRSADNTSDGAVTLGTLSIGSNPATTGVINLSNNGLIASKHSNGSTNMSLLQYTAGDNLILNGGNTNLQIGGTVSSFDGITTTALGFPITVGENISSTQTANFTAISYTPSSAAGRYEVSAVITTTSATNTGTVQVTVDYVDSQGTTHTADIIPLIDAAGSMATTKTGASKEFHTPDWKLSINNAGTAIVVKVVVTGTVSYTVSPLIKRITA